MTTRKSTRSIHTRIFHNGASVKENSVRKGINGVLIFYFLVVLTKKKQIQKEKRQNEQRKIGRMQLPQDALMRGCLFSVEFRVGKILEPERVQWAVTQKPVHAQLVWTHCCNARKEPGVIMRHCPTDVPGFGGFHSSTGLFTRFCSDADPQLGFPTGVFVMQVLRVNAIIEPPRSDLFASLPYSQHPISIPPDVQKKMYLSGKILKHTRRVTLPKKQISLVLSELSEHCGRLHNKDSFGSP